MRRSRPECSWVCSTAEFWIGPMKIVRFIVILLATVAWLWKTPAKSDESGKQSPPAADSMLGKEPGQVRDDNGLKMKLVWCPPGSVTMGVKESIAESVTEPASAKKLAES